LFLSFFFTEQLCVDAFGIARRKNALVWGAKMRYKRGMDPRTVVEALVERARKVGLPVSELARRADIAPSTFNRWRAGDTSPTLDVFARVERVVTEAEEKERAA